MSQFHDANRRYQQGSLFSDGGYVKDLLKQYGNGGRPIPLPKLSQQDYETGLRFRESEKQRYATMEQRLVRAERLAATAQEKLRKTEEHNQALAGAIDELFKMELEEDTPPPEPTISSKQVTDEPAASRRNRTRRDDAHLDEPSKDGGPAIAEGDDAGGSRADATDGAEPDVGGSAGEHGAPE